MTCTSCSQTNPDAARFCNACGAALAPRCQSCRADNPPGARFCNGCGTALAARPSSVETRKVVTIVFADLIGSTALHERLDAESVRSLMGRYYGALHAAVEAHGGRVVKLLGDGVMAAFGLPRVAEDDALRAVRAALAMQQAFRALARAHGAVVGEIGLRVAVNTGEVVVEAANDDVVGDPVNVAARLQQEAHDGDVVIGEATRRLVGALITLAPLGTVALRGRAETVAAYRVVSLERPASASTVAFVGRDDELRRLVAVYDAAVAAPAARLAVVLGSPGLGKSRLLDELARRLGGATVLTARCEAAGGATFTPIAKAVRAALRLDDAVGAGEDLATAIEAAVPGDDAERRRIAAGIAALLAGTPAAPEETFFVVRRFLAGLAATQPVVLAIDDLQWAEPLLLDLLEHLVQWSTGVPLLLLAAARPELRDARSSLAAAGRLVTDVVTLAGLDAVAAARLAANVLGADALPAAVAGRVLATSEGNPLFLGELVRMLVDDGALKREGDRWTAGVDLAALDMPPTIHALLAARIERLRAEDRLVLERAAIVGRQFSRAAVAHLLPSDAQADLDARLEALRRSELIEPDAGWFLGEPALRFHHGLIRDAAYRRVLKGTRAELHGRVADWIAGRVGEAVEHDETIGWHLEQAHRHLGELGPLDARGRALGERASRYLAAAGRRALERDDLPLAAGLLGRALERLDHADPGRADLALDWCEALLSAGDVGPAAKALDEIGRFTEGSARLRAWHTCLAGELAVFTDPQALRATADAVAAAAVELAAAGDGAGEAKAHSVHAIALARLGKVGACEAALDKALAAARRVDDRRRSNAVLAGAPLAALWGPSPVARASGRCLDVVRVLRITQGAPAVEAVALRCQAVLEALRGRAEAAQRMIASSRRMVEELGITQQLLESDVYAGLIDLLQGDAIAAERSLRSAYEGLRTHGLGIDAARAAAFLGQALLAQGRAADAEALSHDSEALAGDDLEAAITWRGVRAEALARRGEHDAAVGFARAAVDIAAATDSLLLNADARLALAAALRAAGRRDESDAEEQRAIALWEAKGATVAAERARPVFGRVGQMERALDDRSAPAPPVRRQVGANAATANAARLDAAIAARDADAVSAAFADESETVDHTTGTTWVRAAGLVSFHSLLRAKEPTSRHEPLATLGDSLALCRLSTSASGFVGATFDVGAYEREDIDLIEVDALGRRRRAEIFATGRLGDAVVRLYERYADLLPDGPERTRAAATARSVATLPLVGPHSLDHFDAQVFAPAFEYVDHRTVGMGSVHGAEALRSAVRALLDLMEDSTARTDDVLALRPDALLVRWTHFGTDRAGGGAFERRLCHLWVFGDDGLVTRGEQFDADRDAEALARFDELTAGPAAIASRAAARRERRVRPNAATADQARFVAAFAARDADAIAAHVADGSEVTDHTAHLTYDRRELLALWQGLLRAKDGTCRIEPLATLGDSLALCRQSVSASGVAGQSFDVGPYEAENVFVVEVDGQGRRGRTEVFAADRLGDALVRLYERHAELLPVGPARARAAATACSIATMLGPVDADRYDTAIAPALDFGDHRRVGLESSRGADAWLRGIGALVELADDLANRVDDVLGARSDALLLRLTNFGTLRASGGACERLFLVLYAFGPDGLLTRLEYFDPDRDAEALARFDELAAAPPAAPFADRSPPGDRAAPPVRRRVRPNAATANAARADAALAARDVDAFLARWVEDCEVIDHPTGAAYGLRELGATWRRALRSAPDLTKRREEMATLGDALGLLREWVSASAAAGGTFDVGAYEIGHVFLNEVDAQGRCRRSERFAVDRLGDAVVRLYERYAELLPDGPERPRAALAARSCAALLEGVDLDRIAAALAPGIELADHRRIIGVGCIRGADAVLDVIRIELALFPEPVHRVDDVLALRSDAFLGRSTTIGTDGGGGAHEVSLLALCTLGGDGRVTHLEYFDDDRVAEAFARFDALVPGAADEPAPAARAVRFENAATRWSDRFKEAWEARDWERAAAGHAPGFRTMDRRRMVRLELDRGGHLDTLRLVFEMRSSRFTERVLATRGDRLALMRNLIEASGGDVGQSELEYLQIFEVDDHGDAVAAVLLDPGDLDAAYAELDDRYAAGEAAPYHRTWETLQRFARAAAARDWEGLASVFDPDLVLEDHRPIGFAPLHSRDEFVASVRTLVDLAPDVTLRPDHILALDDRGTLVVWRWTGTRDGGPFEIPVLAVWMLGPDGRIQRIDAYNPEQLDAAWARFAAIGGIPDAARDPLAALAKPNAATVARDRAEAAFEARDWAALRALHVADARIEDRRRRTLISYGVDELIADRQRRARAAEHAERRLVATAGNRVALERVLRTSGPPDGRSEFEHLGLTEVDESGQIVAVVVFDLDDWRAARAECFARALAVDAAAATFRPVYEMALGVNDHDLARVRASLADDLVVHDHRLAGLGLVEGGDAYVESLAVLWRLVPDEHFEVTFEVARERHGVVFAGCAVGTLAEGGAFERPLVIVLLVAGGRITRMEFFEPEDADAALARFAELRPDPLAPPAIGSWSSARS